MVGIAAEAEPENIHFYGSSTTGGFKFLSGISCGDIRGLQQMRLISRPTACQPSLKFTCSCLCLLPLLFYLRPFPTALGACTTYATCAQGSLDVSMHLMTLTEETSANVGQESENKALASPSMGDGAGDTVPKSVLHSSSVGPQ